MTNDIGTLTERSLHAGLKTWLAQPDDQFEVAVDGFVIDIVRGDMLIEIQTRHFGAMKRKLTKLLPQHRIRLLHPIPVEKWIVRQTAVGDHVSRRKSPKRGHLLDLFRELVRIPHLLAHPNLTVEAVLTQQEEVWRDDGQGSWRRKGWSRVDMRLLDVVAHQAFVAPADFLALLPPQMERPFTNRHLSEQAGIPIKTAQCLTYTLRHCDVLQAVGKSGRSTLHDWREDEGK